MTHLLSVDPGLESTGAALWRGSELLATSRAGSTPGGDIAQRAKQVAGDVFAWVLSQGVHTRDVDLVSEIPFVRGIGKTRANPNSLRGMLLIVGGLAMVCRDARTYDPHAWCAVPKAKSGDPLKAPRGARVWHCLTESERMRALVQHDVLDAVGIGLHQLKRFHR